jgi:hypothetical protein
VDGVKRLREATLSVVRLRHIGDRESDGLDSDGAHRGAEMELWEGVLPALP